MIMKELKRRGIEKSPLCVGIDLRPDHIPQEIDKAYDHMEDKLFFYAKEAIDCSREYASCFKVQIACYEAEGLEGLRAYSRILKYIRSQKELVIADIKRGDIGSTAQMYAKAHLEGDFEADILTLSPYMGKDAISPYFDYFKKDKGAFILGKTSNPSSVDFQDLIFSDPENPGRDQKLYMTVLERIDQWNRELAKDVDEYPMGAVVGVNEIGEINKIKKFTDHLFLLVPGYGAQGARIQDIQALIGSQKNGVVNVSRGYTAGIQGDFRKVLKERAEKLAKELRECFK